MGFWMVQQLQHWDVSIQWHQVEVGVRVRPRAQVHHILEDTPCKRGEWRLLPKAGGDKGNHRQHWHTILWKLMKKISEKPFLQTWKCIKKWKSCTIYKNQYLNKVSKMKIQRQTHHISHKHKCNEKYPSQVKCVLNWIWPIQLSTHNLRIGNISVNRM